MVRPLIFFAPGTLGADRRPPLPRVDSPSAVSELLEGLAGGSGGADLSRTLARCRPAPVFFSAMANNLLDEFRVRETRR